MFSTERRGQGLGLMALCQPAYMQRSSWVRAVQVKGQDCQVLQAQCEDLQHQLDCLQAEHAKVICAMPR